MAGCFKYFSLVKWKIFQKFLLGDFHQETIALK
jgi:hypothetical protein